MNNYAKNSIRLALTLAAIGGGCSSSPSPSPASTPATDIHALYNTDVAGFAAIDSNSIRAYDEKNDRLFTKIFGGPDGNSVNQYYQARVHYAFTLDDLKQATIVPESFPNQGWLNEAKSPPADPNSQPASPSSGHVELAALNISTILWLEGAVANTPVELTVKGEGIPITSTRTGVMVFGTGYKPTISDDEGKSYPLPPEYRQSILVHEARHSDCTGGLPQREADIMRNASSTEDFLKKIPLPHCGHMHVICPSGTYQGYPACDVEKYGAYTVGADYISALIGAQTDEIALKILQMVALDYDSRFLGSAAESPDELAPNMTSDGLIP